MFANFPDIMSINDIQNALAVGRSTAYRLISGGEIKHWKIGKTIKVPKPFLIDFVVNSCYNSSVAENSPSQGGIEI